MKSFLIKSWPKIIKYIFGPVILILLFWTIGIEKVWDLLTTADLKYFVIAYILFIISVFIAAMNLYALLFPLKKIDPKKYLQYFFASRVTSLVLPGRLGEFSITLLLKREGINLGRGIAAAITDKLITICCSIVFGLAGMYTLLKVTEFYAIVFYFAVGVPILVLLLSSTSRRLIKKLILRKYAHHFEGFSATLFSYAKENKGMTILNAGITLFRIVIIALSAKYMFLAFGTSVPLLTLILVGGIETLSTFMPLTVNGLGIKQAIGIYVFSALGISPAISGARYFMGLFIQYSFGFLSTFLIKKNFVPENETTY